MAKIPGNNRYRLMRFSFPKLCVQNQTLLPLHCVSLAQLPPPFAWPMVTVVYGSRCFSSCPLQSVLHRGVISQFKGLLCSNSTLASPEQPASLSLPHRHPLSSSQSGTTRPAPLSGPLGAPHSFCPSVCPRGPQLPLQVSPPLSPSQGCLS